MNLRSPVHRHIRGMPLADYLAQRFTYHPRDEWVRIVLDGNVLVNGSAGAVDQPVSGGDEITYCAEDFIEPPADLDYRVVYEDEWMLGIAKPGNLLVHRAGRSFRSNLIYHVRQGRGHPPYPAAHTVNRLDRETSGVVLVAKEAETLKKLQKAFRDRRVEKEYVAVVHGHVDPALERIDGPIARCGPSAPGHRFRVVEADGKEAVTDVAEVHHLGPSHSLLRLLPRTGRTHQLRVHCHWLGHPIVGDKLYGMEESEYVSWLDNPEGYTGQLEFPRQALHCLRVTFNHPFLRANVTVEAPIPDDLQGLVGELEASGEPGSSLQGHG